MQKVMVSLFSPSMGLLAGFTYRFLCSATALIACYETFSTGDLSIFTSILAMLKINFDILTVSGVDLP